MKVKYCIDGELVKNLRAWCRDRKLNRRIFETAIYRAKLKNSKVCYPLGFHVIRLKKGL